MKRRFAYALMLAACGAKPTAPVVVPPPPMIAPPVASSAVTTTPTAPTREPKPIALAGPNVPQNAVWIEKGFLAVVTRTGMWRVRPESPELVSITPLDGQLGAYGVITGAPNSSLVAAALADGRVELHDESGRRQVLPVPAGKKVDQVLDLKLSPDAKVLAVNRDGPTWKEETTFYDVSSGAVLGKVDGGNVVFDPSGKYVAGRGGVASLDGKTIKEWKEGFFVLGGSGRLVPMDRAGGGEVMAGDYVARGWFKGQAVYAGDQTVELIDPATGASTAIDAKCGGRKISTTADLAHNRMIGICEDAVLLTDLDTHTTKRIAVLVQKGGFHFAVDVTVAKDSEAFTFMANRSEVLVKNGALQNGAAAREEIERIHVQSAVEQCLRPDTPRKAIKCSLPAIRADGSFIARIGGGLSVASRAGNEVIAWRSYGRGRALQTHPPIPPTSCGAPPASSGMKEWSAHESGDGFTAYSSIKAANSRVTAYVTCICTAKGCTKSEIAGFADSPIAYREDGSILTVSTNPTMTESTLMLHRAQRAPARVKLPESCIHARFGPNGRVFVRCTTDDHGTIYELGANDLVIVGKRKEPPIDVHEIDVQNGELVFDGNDGAMAVPPDWVKDASSSERAMIYAVPGGAITITHDGKVDAQGDPRAIAEIMRCYDGAHLRPYATCR